MRPVSPGTRSIRLLFSVCLYLFTAITVADSTITAPAELDVRGHGPEPDALINHYALENSTPFQIRIISGVCSSNSNTCVGGMDDGEACEVHTDCASTALTFTSGKTEYFDADGNSIAGPYDFTEAEFEKAASLQDVGICNVDSTIACGEPGGDDEDACGDVDSVCNVRPSAGYIPHNANRSIRNPKEIVGHNIVPAAGEIRICFDEYDSGMGCEEVIVRQSLAEYRTPEGPTYIYPMPPPDTVDELLENNEAHEYFSHHRGPNNQRHAYDIWSTINGNLFVGSSCDVNNSVCVGGTRDGEACSEDINCAANPDWYVWGEPILAQADGVVVALTQGYPENPFPPEKLETIGDGSCRVVSCGTTSECDGDEIPIVGNSVFIEHANGEVSMAAHMIPGSSDHLSCGDVVMQGEALGLVGNSGNSTAPHLHYSTDVDPQFWSNSNYSVPSYHTNLAFSAGPDPTIRRQLDVSQLSFTSFYVWSPVTPLPMNPPLAAGATMEVEPNNTLNLHNALTLDTTVSGEIENADVGDIAVRGDGIEDIFRFDLGTADEIRVELTGADPAENLDVYVLTEDMRVLNETGQGTSQGSYEEVCLNLDAGAYYVMASNVELTQDKAEDYTLDVSSDPQTISASIINAQQPVEVDDDCLATVSFQIDIHDNCCLDVDNLDLMVDATNPTNNLTLGSVQIDSITASNTRDVVVLGHVDVYDVTSCPAQVVIEASAQDCSGNIVDTITQSSGAMVDVIDTIPPEIDSSDADAFCLWPPEHNYVCFEASQFSPTINDNCPVTPVWEFESCSSDQPDNGLGDGETIDDCVLDVDLQGFCARSERQGHVRGGRRYNLGAEATDACGNVSLATEIGNIYVPRDEAEDMMCIDSTLPQ